MCTCTNYVTLLTLPKTYQACLKNIRNAITMIDFTVLNKTRIAFSFCNVNILDCYFQNLRCGTTSNLILNGPTFSNILSVFVALVSTFWCMLIPMTLKFREKAEKSALLLKLTHCALICTSQQSPTHHHFKVPLSSEIIPLEIVSSRNNLI